MLMAQLPLNKCRKIVYVVKTVSQFWNSIISCWHVLCLTTADPHVQYSAVSSFVFLRFFAVAVLSPHSFQLRSHHPVSSPWTATHRFTNVLESKFTCDLLHYVIKIEFFSFFLILGSWNFPHAYTHLKNNPDTWQLGYFVKKIGKMNSKDEEVKQFKAKQMEKQFMIYSRKTWLNDLIWDWVVSRIKLNF